VVKRGLMKFIRNDLASISAILIIMLVIVISMSQPARLGYSMTSLTKDIAIFTIVGLAQMATLAVGQFNLAVGAIGGVTGMICGYLINMPTTGDMSVEKYVQAEVGLAWPWIAGLLVAMLVGLILGFIQGGIIVKTKINPFIVSLALISIFHGVNMAVTQNMYFRKLPEAFIGLNTSTFPATPTPDKFGFPIAFFIALAVMLIMWVIYNRTATGRRMLATGVSKRSADFAGISSNKYILVAHCISGMLCAIAGALTASKLAAAQVSIGENWLLYSFAAPILGGTLLSGGKVSIVGTMIGAGIMTVIVTVLALLKLDTFTHQIFIGGILLLTFMLNMAREALGKRQDKVLVEVHDTAVESGGDK